jgi:hypothetical protein
MHAQAKDLRLCYRAVTRRHAAIGPEKVEKQAISGVITGP